MDEQTLREWLARGEDIHTDFKSELENEHHELAKDIVSFANTDGGQIIIGVEDDGRVVGVADLDGAMRKADDVASNRCEPPVTVVPETVRLGDRNLVVLGVPKGSQRPYRTRSGQYYIRSGNRCRQASREELLRLFQASESLYYDETPLVRAGYSDLDLNYFSDFAGRYLEYSVPEEEMKPLLRNFHLLSMRDQPTIAGMAFFGKQPAHLLPTAGILCALVQGDDIAIPPADKKALAGRVPEMIEDARRFLYLYLPERHVIRGFEPEGETEIPEVALREGMINAVAHRDYTINAPIRIIIFRNRVEIRTPGRLPNTVTIESMKAGGSHVLRNPTIYNLLAKMRLVTHMGSGVRRLIKAVKEKTGQDVLLEATDGEFILTLPRLPQHAD